MVHGDVETHARGGRWGLARVSRGERVLATMVDAYGYIARSHVMAAVAFKPAMVIASLTYGDAQPRVREVEEVLLVAGHQRAMLGSAPRP